MSDQSLLEKELDELYKKVKAGEHLGRLRRFLAYGLKIVAGGSGLIVATGIFPSADQGLGIAVLVAVFIDSVFSNHMRLIAETNASHAYKALSRKVKAQFNRERDSVARRANNGDQGADAELEEMMKNAHLMLSDGIDDIEAKLADIDIKALQALSLDEERKKQ